MRLGSLRVEVGGLQLEHPVMNASGVLGARFDDIMELVSAGVSAVVTKSFTLEPREPNPTPIIVPVEDGYVNSVGLSNPGLEGLRSLIPRLVRVVGRPLIVSIAASSPEEAGILSREAFAAGASAVELNLSCPHARGRGLEVAYDRRLTLDIIDAAVEAGGGEKPVWAKIGYLDRVAERAAELVERGVSAVVAINTLKAMVIDVWAARPVLGGRVGGLSGRAIHPVATRIVYEIHCEHPDIHVVGVGGVYTWRDAAELILAGARAVQVGTALFDKGLGVVREIVEGLRAYLEKMGWRLEDAIGAACRR